MVDWYQPHNGHELSKLQEIVKDREAWCAEVQVIHDRVTEQQLQTADIQSYGGKKKTIFLSILPLVSVFLNTKSVFRAFLFPISIF